MSVDRIRFVNQDEGSIECCVCNVDIQPGNLVNEFESSAGKIDPYCMKCLTSEAKEDCVWEKKELI